MLTDADTIDLAMFDPASLADIEKVGFLVFSRIVQQGGPGVEDEYHRPQYRTRSGRRCAVGWVVPDSTYTCAMEGLTVGKLTDPNRSDAVLKDLVRWRWALCTLQTFHDNLSSSPDWRKDLHLTIDRWLRGYTRIPTEYKEALCLGVRKALEQEKAA